MAWNDILNEIRKLRNTGNPAEGNPNTSEEPKPLQEEIPQKQWYQMGDWFTRNDELLESILLQLKAMGEITPPPTVVPPEAPVIPPGMLAKLDVVASEQIRTKELLEGFSFITGQSVVATPGTAVEVISTVKTYLVIIRAHITNTGLIYVGGTGVGATTGYILDAGEAMAVPIDNIKRKVWMDAAVAGEGVSWIALVD